MFFVLVPRLAEVSPWGEWFTLGWPLPALALKLGYMSPESPRGPHLSFNPLLLLNAALWFAAFYSLQRIVRADLLSPRGALVIAVLALVVGGAWFGFGMFHVISVMVGQSQS